MAKRRMSVTEAATELAESYVNGNQRHVRDSIQKMPTKIAVGVALYVHDYLGGGPNSEYLQRSFLRWMTDNI